MIKSKYNHNYIMESNLDSPFYLWHTGLGNGGGKGGGGGGKHVSISFFLYKNRFLTNRLLFGNTKVCCYK